MRTISIVTVVDVVKALANNSLDGSIYLMDNNKDNGSTDEGTEVLKTKVNKGDRLVWIARTLECEAYASIAMIEIDREYCEPREKTYKGTGVTYWVGIVKKNINKSILYNIKYNLASRIEEMSSSSSPCLIGEPLNSLKGLTS